MRIFLSCQQSSKVYPIPAYRFWERYFKKGIEEAGHEWTEAPALDWAEGLLYADRPELEPWLQASWATALDVVRKEHRQRPIDLFLSYLFPHQVNAAVLKEIRALGIPCVNFFCDTVREFKQVPEAFKAFDLHWVPEFQAGKMYARAGLRFVHAPMPVWVRPELRQGQPEEEYGVTFIGSRDIQREILLGDALRRGAAIEIRGAGWEKAALSGGQPQMPGFLRKLQNQMSFIRRSGWKDWFRKCASSFSSRPADALFELALRPMPGDDEYLLILQKSIVALGINRYPSFRTPASRPATYSRLRDIEAPMLGACYLTEWTEGLDQLYDIGKEIEVYRSVEEMVSQIHRLKADPGHRQSLRRKGQMRALAQHTVPKSLAKVFQAIGRSEVHSA